MYVTAVIWRSVAQTCPGSQSRAGFADKSLAGLGSGSIAIPPMLALLTVWCGHELLGGKGSWLLGLAPSL